MQMVGCIRNWTISLQLGLVFLKLIDEQDVNVDIKS